MKRGYDKPKLYKWNKLVKFVHTVLKLSLLLESYPYFIKMILLLIVIIIIIIIRTIIIIVMLSHLLRGLFFAEFRPSDKENF